MASLGMIFKMLIILDLIGFNVGSLFDSKSGVIGFCIVLIACALGMFIKNKKAYIQDDHLR